MKDPRTKLKTLGPHTGPSHHLSPGELSGILGGCCKATMPKQKTYMSGGGWSPGQQCFPKARLSSLEKKNSLLRFDECEYFACLYVCELYLSVPCASDAHEGQQGPLDFMERELQMVVSLHTGSS